MVAVVSADRLDSVWTRLLNAFLGRKAVKQVDACARFWGKVSKVSGAKVDVTLDASEIPSPSGVPLYLGLPGSSVDGIEGQRVLVGFRNGDLTQPFVDDFEQASGYGTITIGQDSPKAAAREGDPITHGTIAFTFNPGTGGASLAIVYVPGDGTATQTLAAGTGTLTVHEDVLSGSGTVEIGD